VTSPSGGTSGRKKWRDRSTVVNSVFMIGYDPELRRQRNGAF